MRCAGIWKVYGPDLNGRFGGLQGTGGLEAVILDADGTTTGVINDQFGNGVATVSGGTVTWSTTRVGAYGPLPGIQAQTLTDVTQVAAATAWRSRRIDPTGFYWLGARFYEPTSGRFLSADPLGHAASMSLYDYCRGDPVNFFDPKGLTVAFAPGLSEADKNKIISINTSTSASPTQRRNWQTLVQSHDTYTVTTFVSNDPYGSTAEYDSQSKTIRIDPTVVPVVYSTQIPLTLEQVWAHEVSHAAQDARDRQQYVQDHDVNVLPQWDPNLNKMINIPVEEVRATNEENQISDELGIDNKRENYSDLNPVFREVDSYPKPVTPITKKQCPFAN